ncbi:MAG: hypothetical protein L6Q68_08975 [Aquabacterium sp.]|nr:hypothetical protein [Aquabacterium sp.]
MPSIQAVQDGIDAIGVIPCVVNERRSQAFYTDIARAALPPQLSVTIDATAPNARRLRGRVGSVEVAGVGYLSESGDVFKSLVVGFDVAH